MKSAFISTLLMAAPVCAEESLLSGKSALPSSQTTTTLLISAPPPTDAPVFLQHHGTFSSDMLVRSLNAKLTPVQRQQLDSAVERRNGALSAANAELGATLRAVLGESNQSLDWRLEDEAELRRLEDLRRRQPQRYFYFKERLEKRQKARNNAKMQPVQ